MIAHDVQVVLAAGFLCLGLAALLWCSVHVLAAVLACREWRAGAAEREADRERARALRDDVDRAVGRRRRGPLVRK